MKEIILTIVLLYFFYRFAAFLFECWNIKGEARRKYREQFKNHNY